MGATSTADWILAEGWREGLFMQCIEEGAPTPLPFNMDPSVGCSKARSAGYVGLVAAFVIIGLICDFFGTFLTGLGLRSTDPNKKYKYYRVAIYALVVSLIALTLAAIIYPVQFSKDLANEEPLNGDVLEPKAYKGSLDFDGDGLLDVIDDDDDNEGLSDEEDPDDDNDGINDELDEDDDNDGVDDSDELEDREDFDGDGIHNDDDEEDEDDDNDGIVDSVDRDDDNDGIPDSHEEDTDVDGEVNAIDKDDGLYSDEEDDDDNDGITDDADNDDDNDGVPDEFEDDSEEEDTDGDGEDDDGDGIDDEDDLEGGERTYEL